MFQNIVIKLKQIAGHIAGQTTTIESIPADDILNMVSGAASVVGADGEEKKTEYAVLLDCALKSGNGSAVAALLLLIAGYLEEADQRVAERKSAEYYLDVLCHRIPLLNWYINDKRKRMLRGNSAGSAGKAFGGRGCVFSVVTGGYDKIADPAVVNPDWDYILFTDSEEIESEIWEIRHIGDEEERDAAKLSRLYKILAHRYLDDYDYSIYIDGNMRIKGDLKEYIRLYSEGESLLCLAHYINTDIYQEAELCKRTGKGNAEQIDQQIESYRKEGFPEYFGLAANGFLIRNHRDEKMKQTMEAWWEEVSNRSGRDQISLTYCCWKNKFLFDLAPLYCEDNSYVEFLCQHRT